MFSLFGFFYPFQLRKVRLKLGKTLKKARCFLFISFSGVWVGVQITSHSFLNHIFLSPLNVMGKTLKQLMEGETPNYIFFKVKQDSRLISHQNLQSSRDRDSSHVGQEWDKGWTDVMRSHKTEWLCHPGSWRLMGTGLPCRIRVRNKAQTCQLQYSDSGTRGWKAEKSQQCPGGVAGEGPKAAEKSILDLQVKGCWIIFTLKENGCNGKCSEPSRNARGGLEKNPKPSNIQPVCSQPLVNRTLLVWTGACLGSWAAAGSEVEVVLSPCQFPSSCSS